MRKFCLDCLVNNRLMVLQSYIDLKDSWNKFKCFLQYLDQHTINKKVASRKKPASFPAWSWWMLHLFRPCVEKKSLLYQEFAHCAEIVVLMGRLRRFFLQTHWEEFSPSLKPHSLACLRTTGPTMSTNRPPHNLCSPPKTKYLNSIPVTCTERKMAFFSSSIFSGHTGGCCIYQRVQPNEKNSKLIFKLSSLWGQNVDGTQRYLVSD